MHITRNLVAAIIYRAVVDFEKDKDGVRAFFKSEYGRELCDYIDLNAEVILERLENGQTQVVNGRLSL